MSKKKALTARRKARSAPPLGSAQFRCNICGDVITRKLGRKLWTKSLCMKTGKMARLYRISAPNTKLSHAARHLEAAYRKFADLVEAEQ